MKIIYKILDKFGYYRFRKALLVPVNSEGQVLIQDRRGHRPPSWGYFGGGIEPGETPIVALIREVKEELNLTLVEVDVQEVCILTASYDAGSVIKYVYLYRTDQETFTVLEGAGAYWVAVEEAKKRLNDKDQLVKVMQKIDKI